MYNLFNEDSTAYTGDINISILNFVKGNLSRELNRLVLYFREVQNAVNSNHFLTRIMNQIPISLQEDLDYYYLKTLDRSQDIAMSLKMTSAIYKGKVFDGMIYGPSTKEIYISVAEDLDNYRDVDWKDLKPIRVLAHPRTSIFFNPIRNEDFENEIGVAVFAIDITMLMIQYRKWSSDPQSFDKTVSDRSMMQFIAMVVLPSILYSHLDVAIFNRLNSWRYGTAPNDSVPKFPIAIINYTNQLDKVLIDLNEKLDRFKKEFVGVLRNVPSVSTENYLKVIRTPPMAITRNNKWALFVSRIPTIKFLFRRANDLDINRNMVERNEIMRQLREFKNDRTLEQALPPEMFKEVIKDLDEHVMKPI